MSGIYIPGMKMPKNCEECKCNYYECAFLERSAEEIMEYFGGDKRHPDCPLIEVPEQKHGQWIRSVDELGEAWMCSECLEEFFPADGMDEFISYVHYCPNCGARMDDDSKSEGG